MRVNKPRGCFVSNQSVQATRVMQVGMGPIGLKIARLLSQRSEFSLVAAVDLNPDLLGVKLADLINVSDCQVTISGDVSSAIDSGSVEVAVVTTSSKAEHLFTHIKPLVSAGISVVTTCEELFYPWKTQPKLSRELDQMAKKSGCAVLSTGINPGFLMDYWPVLATGLAEKVQSITVNRVQDASERRKPFQQKIGVGLSLDEFENEVRLGRLRHVGLPESVDFIAAKLGWRLTDVKESIEPIMGKKSVQGVKQVATGYLDDEVKITLNFTAAIDQANPKDEVIINGDPSYTIHIDPPVNGDVATAAVTVNSISALLSAEPGLRVMSDLSAISV
jgi:2,4-diaminopentanoate dehydrogenase